MMSLLVEVEPETFRLVDKALVKATIQTLVAQGNLTDQLGAIEREGFIIFTFLLLFRMSDCRKVGYKRVEGFFL